MKVSKTQNSINYEKQGKLYASNKYCVTFFTLDEENETPKIKKIQKNGIVIIFDYRHT